MISVASCFFCCCSFLCRPIWHAGSWNTKPGRSEPPWRSSWARVRTWRNERRWAEMLKQRLETGTSKFRVWNHDFSDEVFLICPQGRVARIQQIEKDMLRIRTRLQAQSADAEVLDYSAVYNKVVFRGRDWTLDSRLEAISTKFYKLKEYFTQKWKFAENVLTLRQSKR